MKTMITIAAAAVLATGCGTVRYVSADGREATPRDFQECEYEALKATAGVMNAAQAGWMAGQITNRCMAMKGFARTTAR
jgi:hypothetical protein